MYTREAWVRLRLRTKYYSIVVFHDNKRYAPDTACAKRNEENFARHIGFEGAQCLVPLSPMHATIQSSILDFGFSQRIFDSGDLLSVNAAGRYLGHSPVEQTGPLREDYSLDCFLRLGSELLVCIA